MANNYKYVGRIPFGCNGCKEPLKYGDIGIISATKETFTDPEGRTYNDFYVSFENGYLIDEAFLKTRTDLFVPIAGIEITDDKE